MLSRLAFCCSVIILGFPNTAHLHSAGVASVSEMTSILFVDKEEADSLVAAIKEGEEEEVHLAGDRLIPVVNSFTLAIGETAGPTCGIPDNGYTTVVPVDATPPLSYLWSNGDTTARIENLTAGIYMATVTDGLGCIETSLPITLQAQDPLVLSCSEDVVILIEADSSGILLAFPEPDAGNCPINDLVHNLAGATTQSDLPGAVDLQFFVVGTTTVTYVAQDQQANCSFTVTVEQVVDDCETFGLSPNSINAPICSDGTDGNIALSILNGEPDFVYSWSNGRTVEDISSLEPGLYTLTVTDANDCEVSGSFWLQPAAALELSCSVLENPPSMGSTSGSVMLTFANTLGITSIFLLEGEEEVLLHEGLAGDYIINNLVVGDYTFLIRDENNCSTTCSLLLDTNMPGSCNRLADSLVLVDFYNSTNGDSWVNSWNLTASLDTWYGVILNEEGCVSCLDLDGNPNCIESVSGGGNNVSGVLPENLGQLGGLEGLYLTDNFVEGGLPASITQLPELRQILLDNNLLTDALPLNLSALTSLDLILIDFNRLTFEDILHQVPFLTSISYDYANQASIFPDSLIQRNVGDNLVIDLGIDDTVSTNIYTWSKDGVLFPPIISGSNELTLNDLQVADAGVYSVSVTNPNAPDLTLLSGEITLDVIAMPPSPIELSVPEVETTINTPTCVPIIVSGFTDVGGFQFVLAYDTEVLRFIELTNIHPDFPLDAPIEATLQPDGILLNWVLLLGGSVDLPTDAILAEACFEPLSCGNQTLDIPLPGETVTAEFITESLVLLPIEAIGGNLNVSSNLELSLIIGNPTCEQDNGVVSAEVINGSGNYTYLWNVPGNTPMLGNLSAGNSYALTVTGIETGCTAIAVTEALVNQGTSTTMSLQETICQGENYPFNGEQLSESGTYQASFTTSSFNCDSTVTLILEVLSTPVAEIMGDTTFCLGDGPQTLTVALADTYQWSTGSTTQSTLVDSELTQVSVTVTNAGGCTSSDMVQILSGEVPEINISGDQNVCDGQSTLLTASGGVSYEWSNGSTNATTELLAGTHAVEVINAAGCTNIELVTITDNPLPVLPAYESEQIGCGNGTLPSLELVVDAPLTIDWYTEGSELLAAGQTIYSPAEAGVYLARVRHTTTGCESTDVAVFNYSEMDIIPPVMADCPEDISVVLNTAMMDEVIANWTAPTAADNCEVASLTSNFSPGSTFNASTQVTYTATDVASNETGCSFNINVAQTDELTIYVDSAQVTVTDNLARVPIYVTNFTEVEGLSFSLRLMADTLAAEILDTANVHPTLLNGLIMSLEGNPDTLLRFFWSDISGNPVNLSLPDSTVLFELLIELTGDPGACAELVFTDDPLGRIVSKVGVLEGVPSTLDGPVCRPAIGTLAGYVRRADGSRIIEVEVSCVGEEETLITYTDEMGYYEFANLELGKPYTLTPRLDTMHRNGVNVIDRTLMSRHILQSQPLMTPYLRIAADVTGDGSINIIDFVQEGYLILQIFDRFPTNSSWRFVDAEYTFPNPNNPWAETFPESRRIELLSKDSLQNNFIGMKIGDLNDSASSFGGGGASLGGADGPIIWLEQDVSTEELFVLNQKTKPNHDFITDYLWGRKVVFITEHLSTIASDFYSRNPIVDDD